ncbi:hypothetical protein [Hymenobacter fodinae]|uniref:Uncharacterized protein n=1 Tax=Hymenobacter fodinae TaxID=2510796 RepID=A0A4Z0P3I2_9BACT|nr:hypothetical protein [Hymenobacter fodinae]TGE05570.1 hypothetical protein EU556_19920 [Hymenobacter fodinae]
MAYTPSIERLRAFGYSEDGTGVMLAEGPAKLYHSDNEETNISILFNGVVEMKKWLEVRKEYCTVFRGVLHNRRDFLRIVELTHWY